MSTDPFSPQQLNYAAPPARNDLRNIAFQQRAINLCILAYIITFVVSIGFPPELRVILGIVLLGTMVTSAVFIFMLAISLYNTGVGIVLGILTLIPLVGLIILLIVNSKATGVLRAHGYKVGLLGADPKQIPPTL